MASEASNHKSFSKWLRGLITPASLSANPIERRRGQALLLILLVAFVVGTFTIIVRSLIGSSVFTIEIGLIALIALYIMSRWWSYRIGIYATIITGSLLNPFAYFLLGSEFDPLTTISAALIVIILADLLATPQATLLTFIFNVSLVTGLLVTASEMSTIELLQIISPILFVTPFIIIKSYVTQFDLKQLNQQTQSLNSQEKQFQDLFRAIPEAVIIKNSANMVIFCNDRASQLMGFESRAEVEGAKFDRFVEPGHSGNFRPDKSSGIPVYRYHDKLTPATGKAFTVNIVETTITFNDELATLMILSRDMGTSDDLIRELIMLRTVVENIHDAIIITDTDLKNGPHIEYVNPAYAHITGYDTSDLVGRRPHVLRGPETETEDLDKIYARLADGLGSVGETTHYRRDGQPFKSQWKVVLIRDEETGEVIHFVSIQRDVTLQRMIENDLYEKQERISMMSELSSDFAYLLEVKDSAITKLEWLTDTSREVFGRSHEELSSYKGLLSYIHPDDVQLYRTWRQALIAGESRTLEYRIVRPDNTVYWIHDSCLPIKDENGHVNKIYGAGRDVTAQHHATEALRTQSLQKQILSDLVLNALSLSSFEELCYTAVKLCARYFDDIESLIAVQDDDVLRVLKSSSTLLNLPANSVVPLSAQLSLLGYAFNQFTSVIVPDYAVEDRFKPLSVVKSANIQSAIAVTIHSSTDPLGVFAMYSRNVQAFSHKDVVFLQSLANVMTTFIERLRAQKAEREEREFSEVLRDATIAINSDLKLDDMMQNTLEAVTQIIPQHNHASIALWSDDDNSYRFVFARGYDVNLLDGLMAERISPDEWSSLRRMLDTQRPLIISDVQADLGWVNTSYTADVLSTLGAPIIVQDKTLGFIFVDSDKLSAFVEKDAQRLQSLAEKVGNAIINARYTSGLQKLVVERTKELQREQEELRTILNATDDGIFYTENNVMRYGNQAFAEMTGYEVEEFIGAQIDILYPEDITDDESDLIQSAFDVIQEKRVWRNEIRICRKDKTIFPAELTISLIGEFSDNVQRTVCVVRDIHAEKEAEDFRERFIANAAHELRTPIANLNTSMYLMKRQPEKFDTHFEKLSLIIERMTRLVRDLLNKSSLEAGHIVLDMDAIILQEIVTNVFKIQQDEADKKSIALVNNLEVTPIHIEGDFYRLEQVFTNLVTNAIRHTPEQGEIRLYCIPCDTPENITIVVEDTGEGIPSDEVDYIFQPFHRVGGVKNESGTGLGLSITQDIITRHNGTITVESTVNVGTAFYITLPRLEP